MTGIANRRKFDEALAQEWLRMRREQKELGLILCDIDWFKQYNDNYGHQKGDECLKIIAKILSTNVRRSGDLVARYGGEEFVTLLPDTTIQGCLVIAERMRAAVERLAIEHNGSQISSSVTMSFGVASIFPGSPFTPNQLLIPADKALYRAKEKGRNRICS